MRSTHSRRAPRRIKTADDRSRHLAWWRENFGNVKLFHFKADAVEKGREQLAAENIERRRRRRPKRTPQTVRHYLMSLSSCMDYARRKKRWIEKNPVSDIDAPPVSPGRIRWLSDDERKRLLEACDQSGNPDLAMVVRIALASGARQAEIMYLRWPMIDLDRGVRIPADDQERRAAGDAVAGRYHGDATGAQEGPRT